jgi:hypothetical protein
MSGKCHRSQTLYLEALSRELGADYRIAEYVARSRYSKSGAMCPHSRSGSPPFIEDGSRLLTRFVGVRWVLRKVDLFVVGQSPRARIPRVHHKDLLVDVLGETNRHGKVERHPDKPRILEKLDGANQYERPFELMSTIAFIPTSGRAMRT